MEENIIAKLTSKDDKYACAIAAKILSLIHISRLFSIYIQYPLSRVRLDGLGAVGALRWYLAEFGVDTDEMGLLIEIGGFFKGETDDLGILEACAQLQDEKVVIEGLG